MKISLTHDQIGNLMNELDITRYKESEWKEERKHGVKLQKIYQKLHKAYNEAEN